METGRRAEVQQLGRAEGAGEQELISEACVVRAPRSSINDHVMMVEVMMTITLTVKKSAVHQALF